MFPVIKAAGDVIIQQGMRSSFYFTSHCYSILHTWALGSLYKKAYIANAKLSARPPWSKTDFDMK